MNALIYLSTVFLLLSVTLSDVIVTVFHPHAVTVTYDPVLNTVLPPSPPQNHGGDYQQQQHKEQGSDSQYDQEEDKDGKVNAKATASISSRSRSTNLSSKATGATTDANSAFQMNLTFAIGTALAVVLAATIF
jgi:hypothetical protein